MTNHEELVQIRKSESYRLHSVKLMSPKSALVGYKPVDDRIPPYKNGCLCIPAMVTAKSRMLLTRCRPPFYFF